MSEINREATTYIAQYTCDDCEKIPNPGCIVISKDVKLTYPPLYIYECPNCKKEYRFSKQYPYVTYG